MSEREYIDFRKEFKEFAQDLENSKPMFEEEELSFDDFDSLFGDSQNHHVHSDRDIGQGPNEELSDDFDDLFMGRYPEISLETDDMLMNLMLKRDYSEIDDLNRRKEEFFKDLRDFIDEFESTEESDELMKFYDA